LLSSCVVHCNFNTLYKAPYDMETISSTEGTNVKHSDLN